MNKKIIELKYVDDIKNYCNNSINETTISFLTKKKFNDFLNHNKNILSAENFGLLKSIDIFSLKTFLSNTSYPTKYFKNKDNILFNCYDLDLVLKQLLYKMDYIKRTQ